MSEIYYIDGYNIIHAAPRWSELADQSLEAAREALIEATGAWCAATGNRATIFFDGQGKRTESAPHSPPPPGVEVIYTARRVTADAVIERGVYRAPKRSDVIVVSGDHGILDLCLGMGAMTMKPENFIDNIVQTAGYVSDRVEDTGKRRRLGPIEDNIAPESRDYLDRIKRELEKASED